MSTWYWLEYITDAGASRTEFASNNVPLSATGNFWAYRIVQQAQYDESGDIITPERVIVDTGYDKARAMWTENMVIRLVPDQDSEQLVLTDTVKSSILDECRTATGFVANRGMLTRVFSQLADDELDDDELDDDEGELDDDELDDDEGELDDDEDDGIQKLASLLAETRASLAVALGDWVDVDEVYIPIRMWDTYDAYKTVSEAIALVAKMTAVPYQLSPMAIALNEARQNDSDTDTDQDTEVIPF